MIICTVSPPSKSSRHNDPWQMKHILPVVVLALAITAPSTAGAQTAEQKGYQIAKKAEAVDTGYRDYTASGKMVLRSKSGRRSERSFNFKNLEGRKSGDKTILVFNWPGDIRDTALLTHAYAEKDDNQWLYLPALRRVKRISSSSRSGSFVGSEFAYEDMVSQELDKFTYRWIADQQCPGSALPCHVIDRFPKFKSGYSRQRVWLDTKHFRVQQVHYFDRRKAHLKTMRATKYRLYNKKFWRASQMTMTNLLTGKSTDLRWKKYRFSVGLSRNAFGVNTLKNLR